VIRSIGGIFCIFGALACIYFAIVDGGKSSQAGVKGVRVLPQTYNFGEVDQHVTLVTQFQVKNESSNTITVESIVKGCSCSETEISPKTIPPGESGILRVRWQVGNRRGLCSEGLSLLYCMDGTQYHATPIEIRATVQPTIIANPGLIEFGASVRSTVRVEMSNRLGGAFRILKAIGSHPAIRVQTDIATNVVDVTFDPSEKGWDSHLLIIKVLTDCERESEFLLPVRINR
jgi:hypothetical protein